MQKRKSAGTSIEVLIDTWWNVNVGAAGLCYVPDVVLIDTWWNVNWTLE